MKRPRTVTAYDVADHYDDAYFDDLVRRYRERTRFARRRIANVFALLPALEAKRLLDVGCGMGTFTVEAARAGAWAVGLDPARSALTAAMRVAHAENVTDASFIQADAARLPLKDASVDVVLAADLAEHLDDATLGKVLEEARRVLRHRGVLVVYTPERAHLIERLKERGILAQDPSHIAVRSAIELRAVVEARGFDDVETRHQTSHVPVLRLLELGLGPWVPLFRRRIGLVARKP